MKKILTIGNALVDIAMSDKTNIAQKFSLPRGTMQLIESEQAEEIFAYCADIERDIVAGGSAANTAYGLALLGAQTGFVGKVGKDVQASLFTDSLAQSGIMSHILKSDIPTGLCQVFIANDGERTMATYLGAAAAMTAEDIDKEIFKQYDILHIEGFLVQDYDLIERALQVAKDLNMTISFDLANYNVINAHYDFLHYIVPKYVDIVFANEDEAKAYTHVEASKAAPIIGKECQIAVVKLGAEGSSFCNNGKTQFVQSVKVSADKVKDTTGAGDLYAAGFLYGFANSLSLEKCAQIGSLCGANIIQYVGARMPQCAWQSIKEKI